MSEKISWNYVVQALNGPSISGSGNLTVDAYDKLDITIADGATQQVDLAPAGTISLVVIQPAQPSDTLTYEVDGNDVKLDGPQIFVGTGAVGLLGAAASSLSFTNATGADAAISILVGRDATP